MRYVCSEPEAKGFIAAVAILYFPTHMNCIRGRLRFVRYI